MVTLVSKLNQAAFTVVPAGYGASQFPLTSCCPVICRGSFDSSSGFVLTGFRRADLETFKRGLKAMYAGAQEGSAETLWSVDGSAVLTLRYLPLGQVTAEFLLIPAGRGELTRLHGRINLDQSYLPALVEQWEALLQANYVED